MSLADLFLDYPKPWANLKVNSLKAESLAVAALDLATLRTTNIQGIGAGTPQVTQIRVQTVADPAQKAANVWADNVGSQAVKTGNIHATNLFTSNLGSPSNKVSNSYAGFINTDQLVVNSSPIQAPGLYLFGYTMNQFYTESPFTCSMYGGFLNQNFDINLDVVGIQSQRRATVRTFDVPSYMQSGSDDKLYFEIPYLQSPELSGTIPFSTSSDPDNFNIAIFYKPAGSSTVSLAPIGFRHFQYGTYAGQDLYFKTGVIFGTEI